MNRVKLVICPDCKAAVGADCTASNGRPRRNSFSRKTMQHRARVELARATVGLIEKGEQPAQLAAYQNGRRSDSDPEDC